MADYDDPRPSSQPVGSTDQVVLKDNLITLDQVVNGTGDVVNRKGNKVTTPRDIESAISAIGYEIIGDFADVTKVEVTESYQVYTSKSISGYEDALWRTNQSLPYTPTGIDPTSGDEDGKWVLVAQGELKSVARSLGVADGEIIYSTDTITELDDIKALYVASTQESYYLDGKPGDSETITSLTNNVLVTSGDTYYLRIAPTIDTKLYAPEVSLLKAKGSQLVERVEGGLSITRSTTRGNINKSGVLETLAVDELGVTSDGASFYGSIENLIEDSEDFSGSYWSEFNTTVSSDATDAPEVGEFADAVIATATSGAHTLSSQSWTSGSYPIADNEIATASIFIKQAPTSTITTCSLSYIGRTGVFHTVRLDFDTGLVTGNNTESVDVIPMSNGWYFICSTFDVGSGTSFEQLRVDLGSYLGTGIEEVYVYGADVSESDRHVPYVATSGSSATADPDIVTIQSMKNLPVSGQAMSIFVEAAIPYSDESKPVFTIASDALTLWRFAGSGNVAFRLRDGDGTIQSVSAEIDDNIYEFGCIFTGDEIKLTQNGAVLATTTCDGSTIDPTLDLSIGGSNDNVEFLDSEACNFEIYHREYSDKQISKKWEGS